MCMDERCATQTHKLPVHIYVMSADLPGDAGAVGRLAEGVLAQGGEQQSGEHGGTLRPGCCWSSSCALAPSSLDAARTSARSGGERGRERRPERDDATTARSLLYL